MAYRMIVLDLDGTLTNARKEITPRTKEVLIKAQERGVRIVLASGRPTYGMISLADELYLAQYDGFIMAFNGGRIVNWTTRNVLFERTLNKEHIPFLVRKATEHDMPILTYQDQNIVTTRKENRFVLYEAFINKMPVLQYDDFINQITYPINKCLIVGDPGPLHRLELEINEEMNGEINVYRSADLFLECVPAGVDKGLSLQRLTNELSIGREEIIACGDGYNDLSMIEYAGLGVAMENANKEVKEIADFVTLSNEDDGVAYVIERFIFG